MIRYKCESCGSTLNIKEELAGTSGKCPKCKTAFTVPDLAADDERVTESDTKVVTEASEATMTSPPKTKKSKRPTTQAAGDDFDPMAVLMGDDDGRPSAQQAAADPPASDDEIPADLDFDLEIGEDDDELPRTRKAKKRKRVKFDSDDDLIAERTSPGSASATADAMLASSASAGAKDLLTRTMEEGRARASRMEDEPPERRGPQFKDYLREYWWRAVLAISGVVVGFYILFWFSDYMTGGGMALPDLGRVYGTVTLDDQPLAGAKVRFTPLDRDQVIEGTKKDRLRSSTAVTDEDGYYDLYYTEGVRGAAVTEHRVVIMKYGDDGKLVTPSEFATLSMETRTVGSGSNKFDFPFQSGASIPPPASSEEGS